MLILKRGCQSSGSRSFDSFNENKNPTVEVKACKTSSDWDAKTYKKQRHT